VLGIDRSVHRYKKRRADDEDELRLAIAELAGKYGRYGYKRITA